MTIWLLAVLLLAGLAYAGFAFGAIRASFAFLGIVMGTLLAFPLGHVLNPIIGLFGVKNPFLLWVTGPFVMFLIVLAVFKIIGFTVHRKVDVYYKYKVGDLRMGLWNRLTARLGLCVGLLNGTAYVILISLVIYVFSYGTSQMVIGDNGSFTVRVLNALGRDVYSSGMAKITAAMDPMPEAYYETLDIVGLIYHNDLLEGRLSRYPGFLPLGERPLFQDIAKDKEFTELRQKQPAFSDIISNPKAQAILDNPDFLKEVWGIWVPNLKDLAVFLRTGQSATYDGEAILGRWSFDMNGVFSVILREKPNLTTADLQKVKRVVRASFTKTTVMASPDKQIYIRHFGIMKPPATPKGPPVVELQDLTGTWESAGGNKYKITVGSKPAMEGVVEGEKLTITGDALPLRFEKDY